MIDFKKKVYICDNCKQYITVYNNKQPLKCADCGCTKFSLKPQYIKKGDK